jgi:hypothetical protein
MYTPAYVYLITYPGWIQLQGISGGTFLYQGPISSIITLDLFVGARGYAYPRVYVSMGVCWI